MSDIFLCGPLGHLPLAERVLGAAVQPGTTAVVADHVMSGAAGGELAALVPCAGAQAEGVLIRDASGEMLARLRYYLAVFGIGVGSVPVNGGAAMAPFQDCADGSDWDAAGWLAGPGPSVVQAAGEIMAHWQTYTPGDMAQRLAAVRSRAVAWTRAQALVPDPGHDPDRDVILHRLHQPYLNFFAVREVDLQFRKQDGTLSEVMNRGGLVMGEAAAVLPYDPAADAVLLIEQFRAPLFMGGSRSPWTWEPVAGMVDPGETPEQTAHREAMEEAGLTLRHLEPLGVTFGSPGALSDRLNLFVGLTDLQARQEASGLDSEGEDIRSRVFGFDELMAGIDAQRFPVLPLITLALWLARHRDRLRALA